MIQIYLWSGYLWEEKKVSCGVDKETMIAAKSFLIIDLNHS